MRVGAVLGLFASGCSFAFLGTPQAPPPGESPSCTSWRGPPIIDLVFGVGTIGVMAAKTFGGDDPDSDVDMRVVGAVTVLVIAVPFLLSARHGFRATGRCRAQEAAFATYQDDYHREQAPMPHLGRAGEACWPDSTCDPGLACSAEHRCDMQRDH
jgi:hypothetical protein